MNHNARLPKAPSTRRRPLVPTRAPGAPPLPGVGDGSVASGSTNCRPPALTAARCLCAVALLLPMLLSPSALAQHNPNVAPNTTGAAVRRVLPAVVKLYGAGLGRAHGYGTGVIVSADGHILTTLSLLARSGRVRVVLNDGRTLYDAKLERSDDYRQLALLKVDAKDLPFLKPADASGLDIGDAVIAIANWYKVADGDEPPSITRGILSMRRNLDAQRLSQDVDYTGPVLIYDAITSNPGAPGGPLIDIHGNFVGLVGKIVESADTKTRLNYALPSGEIADFLGGKPSPAVARRDDVPDAGKRKPAYLGIKLSKLGYQHVAAYVARVRPGSPAAEAGIQSDDLIIGLNGRRISGAEVYQEVLATLVPGRIIQMIVKRGNEVLVLSITVGEKQ